MKKKTKIETGKRPRKKKESINIQWSKSPTGHDVLWMNDSPTYISFGKDEPIKTIRISHLEGSRRVCRTIPVTLNRVPRGLSVIVGEQNMKYLKTLIIDRLEDDLLPRTKFNEIGEIINSGRAKEGGTDTHVPQQKDT